MKKATFFSICMMFFFVGMASFAQAPDRETLMKYVSKANAGTEFWVSFPPSYEEVAGAENTIRLFVASPVEQPITVEVPGKGYSVTKMSVANDVIEFKLPSAIGQAYSKPTQGKAPAEKVYEKCGVHITAQTPVVVYGMTRFQYTSDGFLALPVSKLGNDYIIASWPQYTAASSSFKLPAVSNIVAAYDNTKVTFTMGGPKGSKTSGGLEIGQSRSWVLNAGDVLCFANDDDGQDIAGSRVVSDKPIGIISGNQCASVPAGVPWCDFIDEMELPIKTWGKEYHVTPIVERLYNPVIRVFAHPDYKDVKVYRDGVEWITLSNNSRMENDAFFERRAYDGSPKSITITASAPIYIMLYNTGQADDNVSSDPFQLVLTPVEQYQQEITFATPNAKGGTLPFTRNFVNIVYAMDDGNVVPSDLEFATVIKGQFEWRPLTSRFGPSVGQIFAKKSWNGEQYAMKRIQLPGDGVFRIRAKKPFAAYSYGFSDYDSYGFPTSASVLDASIIDTTPPTITVTQTAKNNWSGSAEDLYTRIVSVKADDVAAKNSGIVASVCLLSDSSYNVKLDVDKTQLYKATPITWSLSVVDGNSVARAIIVVSDNAGNYTYKTFNYAPQGVVLYRKNTKELLCNVTIMNSITDTVTIKNVSTEKSAEIVECTINDTTVFTIDRAKIIGLTIEKSAEVGIPITFTPKQTGSYIALINLVTKNGDSAKIDVSATAKEMSLKVNDKIAFDTTVIDRVSNLDKKMTLTSEVGMYKLPARIVEISTLPSDGVSFENGKYGSEGFQIDKSMFIDRVINETINNKIDVPVKFKALREGLHKATVTLFLVPGKPAQSVEFIGYGKKEAISSVEEENSGDVSIYTNVTNKELVVQGKSLSEMKEYSVINQIGEISLSGMIPFGTESLIIPIHNLPAGMYIFTTEINGKKVQEKFVVMR